MPEPADVARLSRADLAPATVYGLDRAFAAFRRWCATVGASALPADPDTVELYLADRTVGHAFSTVNHARQAIAGRHEQQGLPDPTDTPGVRLLMACAAHALGTRPIDKKPALTETLAARALQAHRKLAPTADIIWSRERAIMLTSRQAQLTLNEVGRISAQVTIDAAGMHLTIASARVGGPVTTVVVPPRGDDVCAVAAVQRWLPHVLEGARDRELFRSAPAKGAAVIRGEGLRISPTQNLPAQVADLIRRRTKAAGVSWRMTPFVGADLDDVAFAATLTQLEPPPDLRLLRARAYTLLGHTSALRHDNLAALDWEDLKINGAGLLLVRLDRWKHNNPAEPHWLECPAPSDPTVDPIAALRDWKTAAGLTSGAVFVPLSGTVRPVPKPGGRLRIADGQADVQLFADLGGLDERFTTRSLRSGRVVTGIVQARSVKAVQGVTLHKHGKTITEYAVIADPFEIGPHLEL